MDRNNKIQDLVITVNDIYAFIPEAKPVEKIKSHAKILAVITKQTTECAHFIHEYAEIKSFGMSRVNSALAHT
jgi:ABC-type polysaccharide/polyol phosphate transport system ATPase subunit